MNCIPSALQILLVSTALSFCGIQKLQIFYMDVGQGDGEIIRSPQGSVVLIDGGKNNCDIQIAYMKSIGIQKIDYLIVSHYHDDHIGCVKEILSKYPLTANAVVYDRGGSYPSSVFKDYLESIGKHRRAAENSKPILLDNGELKIEFVAENGDGIETNNENDLSLVALLHYGKFDAEFGGDLSGYDNGDYKNIEATVAPKIGQVEIYKVHHHCSQYSSNETLLDILKPKVAIISVGEGNKYYHPTQNCVERLHLANVDLYWTETGNGSEPDPMLDHVSGNILVEVEKDGQKFVVSTKSGLKEYNSWSELQTKPVNYYWSSKSNVYHREGCPAIDRIKPENLKKSTTSPEGKSLAKDCKEK